MIIFVDIYQHLLSFFSWVVSYDYITPFESVGVLASILTWPTHQGIRLHSHNCIYHPCIVFYHLFLTSDSCLFVLSSNSLHNVSQTQRNQSSPSPRELSLRFLLPFCVLHLVVILLACLFGSRPIIVSLTKPPAPSLFPVFPKIPLASHSRH